MTLSISHSMGRIALLGVLLFGMLFATSAFAQVQPEVSEATNCRVRANVTNDEAQRITGGDRGGASRGATLSLTGNLAGANSLICAFSWVKWVAQILFVVLMAVAILLFAYAAFLFITAGENAEKRAKAKQFIVWAIVGVLLAIVAQLIPNVVATLVLS